MVKFDIYNDIFEKKTTSDTAQYMLRENVVYFTNVFIFIYLFQTKFIFLQIIEVVAS